MPAHDARDTLKHSPNPPPEQPRAAGHVCLPTIPREQSRLESLGRSLGTVRSYISSVRRASATPSTLTAPASGSRARPRPLSYTAPGSSSSTVGFLPAPATPSVFAQASRPPRDAAGPNVFEDDEEYPTPEDMLVGTPAIGMSAAHEALPEDDGIVWAAFDDAGSKRFLILVYEAGLAVWDVSDLTGIREVLNLRNNTLVGKVLSAVILRSSSTSTEWKGHVLLAIVAQLDDTEHVIIYSLRAHQIVKQFILRGAKEIVAGNRYIVVATSQPTLHVFTPMLEPWVAIPGAALATNPADGDNHPVFALQERLLAFSSTPPAPHIRAQLYNGCGYVGAAPSSALDRASSPMSSYYGMGMGALGAIASTAGVLASSVGSHAGALASTVQAHARNDDASVSVNLTSPSVPNFAGIARRVGEGMWSGLRALANTTTQPSPAPSHRHSSSLGDRAFSKSAPATSGLVIAVGGEPPSPTTTRLSLPRDTADGPPSPARGKAHFVTVVDLTRLSPDLQASVGHVPAHLASASSSAGAVAALDKAVVARMDLSTHHAIVKLAWDSSGTMLAVAGADGGVVRVFGGRWTRGLGTVRSPNTVPPVVAKQAEQMDTKPRPGNKVDGTLSPTQTVAPLPPAAVDDEDDGIVPEPFVNSSAIPTADAGLDVPEVDLITFSAPSSVPSAATALSSGHAQASVAPIASSSPIVPELSPAPPPTSSSAPLSKAARKRARAAAAAAALEPTPPAEIPPRAPSAPTSPVTKPSALRAQPGTSAPAAAAGLQRQSDPSPAPSPTPKTLQPRLSSLNTVVATQPPSAAEESSLDPEMQLPVHLYDLRRGYTSATLRDLSWAFDGRWVAVGSGRGTVHVFATNPYGGKPDERSHLEGLVRNISELQPPSTEIRPIARLRSLHAPSHAFSRSDGRFTAPPIEGTSPPSDNPSANPSYSRSTVAVSFLHRSDVPPILLPHHVGIGSGGTPSSTSPSQGGRFQSSSASPSSRNLSSGTTSSPPLGSKFGHPSQNFQDVLVFDQLSATLTLWRLNVTLKAESESGLSGIGATLATGSAALAGTTPSALRGEEIVIANWPLGRGHDWPEVREPIKLHLNLRGDGADLVGEPRWLAQAELSTHTMERGLVPPPIYLSHQFRFSALKEDFHALIRQTQLDLPTADIQARRIRVQPAHSGHRHGTDLGGGPAVGSLGDAHAVDEAIRDSLDVESGSQTPLLPMLPNGTPRTTLQAGLGRLRREIRQLRSPHLAAHSGHGAPDLEDLQEDDIIDPDVDTSASASINTPSTHATELPHIGGTRRARGELADSLDGSYGWDNQDALALEEAEMFDEISPAGIMDEELAALDRIRSGQTTAKHASGGGYV